MIDKDLQWIDEEARRLGYETCIMNGGKLFWCKRDSYSLDCKWFAEFKNNIFKIEIGRFTSSNMNKIIEWNDECTNFYKIVDLISKYVESDNND